MLTYPRPRVKVDDASQPFPPDTSLEEPQENREYLPLLGIEPQSSSLNLVPLTKQCMLINVCVHNICFRTYLPGI
jgi:hypothetical protein